MPSEKSVNSRKRADRLDLVQLAKASMESVPPLFLTVKLRKTIERLLPVEHHQRLRRYFDIYGCLTLFPETRDLRSEWILQTLHQYDLQAHKKG
jgi:hypothetical protein